MSAPRKGSKIASYRIRAVLCYIERDTPPPEVKGTSHMHLTTFKYPKKINSCMDNGLLPASNNLCPLTQSHSVSVDNFIFHFLFKSSYIHSLKHLARGTLKCTGHKLIIFFLYFTYNLAINIYSSKEKLTFLGTAC